MSDKEVTVSYDSIRNPQTITKVVNDACKAQGLDIHKNDVLSIEDDSGAGKRVYKFKSRKLFGPWSHRG